MVEVHRTNSCLLLSAGLCFSSSHPRSPVQTACHIFEDLSFNGLHRLCIYLWPFKCCTIKLTHTGTSLMVQWTHHEDQGVSGPVRVKVPVCQPICSDLAGHVFPLVYEQYHQSQESVGALCSRITSGYRCSLRWSGPKESWCDVRSSYLVRGGIARGGKSLSIAVPASHRCRQRAWGFLCHVHHCAALVTVVVITACLPQAAVIHGSKPRAFHSFVSRLCITWFGVLWGDATAISEVFMAPSSSASCPLPPSILSSLICAPVASITCDAFRCRYPFTFYGRLKSVVINN